MQFNVRKVLQNRSFQVKVVSHRLVDVTQLLIKGNLILAKGKK